MAVSEKPFTPPRAELPIALQNLRMRPGIEDAAGPPSSVSAREGYLIFRFEKGDYSGVTLRPEVLQRFVSIKDKKELLEFASAFGPLGLCKKHGWPLTHATIDKAGLRGPWCRDHRILGPNCNTIREKISHWIYYIGTFASVLRLASKLQQEKPPTAADFENWPLKNVRQAAARDPWAPIIDALNFWLYNGCVFKFSAMHGLSSPVVINLVCIPPLFGYLSSQIAAEINRAEHLLCDYCGDSFPAKRKPNPNRRHFCPICREKRIPARLAERDKRIRGKGQSTTPPSSKIK